MEHIENWLYLIIIAIAGISSFINSIRKKSQQAAEQQQQQQTQSNEPMDEGESGKREIKDFWEEIEKTLLPTPEKTHIPEKAPVPQKKREPIVRQRTSPMTVRPLSTETKRAYQSISEQSNYAFDKHLEGQSSIANYYTDSATSEMEIGDEIHASVTLNDLPTDTNEWRKAFVYNEIFNRKY